MNIVGGETEADGINQAIAKAVRRLRTAAGVSQVELSHRLGVDQTAVSRWERGIDVLAAYRIPQIEQALDQPAGTLWATAGLADLRPVSAAIYADPDLEVTQQQTLIAVYESLKGQAGGSGRRPT